MNALTFPNATLCEVAPRMPRFETSKMAGENDGHKLKPQKEIVSREFMERAILSGGYLVTRKYDGEFSQVQVGAALILAEFMRQPISGHFYTAADREMFARFPGGWWAALTVASVDDLGILDKSTRARWGALNALASFLPPNMVIAEQINGVEDFNRIMATGAEGVCAHSWVAGWCSPAHGPAMLAHKVAGIYLCRVRRAAGGTQSVEIEDAETGQDRGKVTLRGGKCDRVRVGSIIRVEAMGTTDAGKLRQPQPCAEWLVRF